MAKGITNCESGGQVDVSEVLLSMTPFSQVYTETTTFTSDTTIGSSYPSSELSVNSGFIPEQAYVYTTTPIDQVATLHTSYLMFLYLTQYNSSSYENGTGGRQIHLRTTFIPNPPYNWGGSYNYANKYLREDAICTVEDVTLKAGVEYTIITMA